MCNMNKKRIMRLSDYKTFDEGKCIGINLIRFVIFRVLNYMVELRKRESLLEGKGVI